ncbi:MAG: Ig-like domain-containing protein [bacterium]|nr:Ig-like domain-containing protein [bacterium]
MSMNRTTHLLVAATALLLTATSPRAQEFTPDDHTLLLLHGNGSLTGAQGETPVLSTGHAFTGGVFGQGIDLPTTAQLRYAATGNALATEGTVEFWVKPHWSGNDGQDHMVFSWGTGGGLLMGKDGGNYWRIILNRYGEGGQPERGAGWNVSGQWTAETWHHCAFTWNADAVRVYVDGEQRAEGSVGFTPPAIAATQIQIGGEESWATINGVVDELRISDIARSAAEVADAYLRGLQITSLAVTPDPLRLLETWVVSPTVTVTTSQGARTIPASALTWSVANGAVASIDADGRVHGQEAGTTTITGTYQGISDAAAVVVSAPVLPPQYDTVDVDLTVPMSGYLYEMPVLVIRYFPTTNGTTVDGSIAGYSGTLTAIRTYTNTLNRRSKFMLEEGSRYRGYANPAAPPSLGYRIVAMITVYEEMPLGTYVGDGHYYPDYNQILERFDAGHYVNDLGVKEVWLWGYHHGAIVPAESNMASPTTGDISNSYRFADDLPIYDHTYVLYNYNFTRSQAEAVHNHGHQLEAILSFANQRQAGDTELFWRKFVGQNASGAFVTGRCGWTHMPPNTTSHYDYLNTALVASDIADWRPDGGGATVAVNLDTWGNVNYAWPENPAGIPQRIESQWYIYWMQSMPGRGNTITYQGRPLTNWWYLTANWDEAANANFGLWSNTASASDMPPSLAAELSPARPNPFNPRTVIPFALLEPSRVELAVFDVAGRRISTLVDEPRAAGYHEVTWGGVDGHGHAVAAGVYVARLKASGVTRSTRLVLVR